jgi:hypothetical protein
MKLFDLIAIKAAMASRVIEGACVWSGSSRLTRKRYLAPSVSMTKKARVSVCADRPRPAITKRIGVSKESRKLQPEAESQSVQWAEYDQPTAIRLKLQEIFDRLRPVRVSIKRFCGFHFLSSAYSIDHIDPGRMYMLAR